MLCLCPLARAAVLRMPGRTPEDRTQLTHDGNCHGLSNPENADIEGRRPLGLRR